MAIPLSTLHMSIDELQQYGQTKAREIRERRERRKVEGEKASVESRLKAFWAPRLWEQTRETIIQRVHAINDALGELALQCNNDKPGIVVIKVAQVPAELSAAFDPSTGKITLTLDDHVVSYDLEVARGEVKLKAVGYFTPSQVAKMLVDKAASMVL